MTTFITAGTSQVGLALARLLHASNHSVLLGSRRQGQGIPAPNSWVSFDWDDASTFSNPFNDTKSKIQSVLLILSTELDPIPQVGPFVDLAAEKGVKRFVLVGAADVPKGGYNIGRVHQYLEEKGVEFVVLRPTWFIDNLARTQLANIRDKDAILTPTPTARVAFVSVDDIAEAAFDALTRSSPIPAPGENKESATAPILLGPELLSYDEVASILTEVLGRKIAHQHITTDEVLEQYDGFGIPRGSETAKFLLNLELGLERGDAERLLELPEERKRVGKVRLRDWAEKNKAVWDKI